MNIRNNKRRTDAAFIALLTLMYEAVVFIGLSSVDLARDIIILSIAFVPFLMAYFSTLSSALTVCAVTVLAILAQAMTEALVKGVEIPLSTCCFLVWIPLTTVCVYLFTSSLRQTQIENRELTVEIQKFTTIDPATGLKNLRAFENDAQVYMNISKRYNMELVMVIWQLKYQEELQNVYDMEELKAAVSSTIVGCLRYEDAVYIVDENPMRWGVMLFTNFASTDIVTGRVETAVANIRQNTGRFIELESGIYAYNGDKLSSLAMLNLAKMQLENQKRK